MSKYPDDMPVAPCAGGCGGMSFTLYFHEDPPHRCVAAQCEKCGHTIEFEGPMDACSDCGWSGTGAEFHACEGRPS